MPIRYECSNCRALVSSARGAICSVCAPVVRARVPTVTLRHSGRAIVRLLGHGIARVLDGKVGLTFFVDNWHYDITRTTTIVHVRDYRYANGESPYQIWTLWLGKDCEEITDLTDVGPRT